ncbi:chromosome 15 open reading frame 34 [Homo sapiens]|uniref:Putative uncharacterized protein encoded by HEXA-AS1 n=1 Tax=Homo sapiens TaxID=9606 RepID=HEAS1_HUMAN|nr:RecName: Full=Putative uncharacterized protein encoded by HEXA-AS1; AltName: Full=HEXA antisense RNA 1; AltName: Full=HEXA antisense gene protein 1 [Homo sapiens]EAW77903.1 chromosome 15 open reading frame 34 [Homo sapiens]BAB14550.1 unnamed protein product [Homo sapiens]
MTGKNVYFQSQLEAFHCLQYELFPSRLTINLLVTTHIPFPQTKPHIARCVFTESSKILLGLWVQDGECSEIMTGAWSCRALRRKSRNLFSEQLKIIPKDLHFRNTMLSSCIRNQLGGPFLLEVENNERLNYRSGEGRQL